MRDELGDMEILEPPQLWHAQANAINHPMIIYSRKAFKVTMPFW